MKAVNLVSLSLSPQTVPGTLILCAVLMIVVGGLPADAQLTPSDDAYTNTASPSTNFGAKPLLDVQSASQNTYILFDLSPLPSGLTGSSIAKATLKLYVNTVTSAGSFNVDFVNGTWAEKTITANLAPALGTTIAASIPLSSSNAKDYIIVDVTSAVQAWLNGTQPNDGVALVGNSPLNATFDSKESTTQSHPPELDIVFASSGGGGTITGINTAAGSGLIGGGTSGTLNLSLTNTCANKQVLQWNGSSWTCATISGSGTVTSVGLSAPASDFIVSGSPVTTSGTLGLTWILQPASASLNNAIVKRDNNASFNANNINLTGSLTLATSNPTGVRVTDTFSNSFAIVAASTAASGPTLGLYGESDSASTNAMGVLGIAASPDQTAGITVGSVGVSTSPRGIGAIGAGSVPSSAFQSNTGAKVGVWGDSHDGWGVVATTDDNNALVALNNSFDPTVIVENVASAASWLFVAVGSVGSCRMDTLGDLACSGTITGGVKADRIDHPLDPANKYLVHANIDSPDSKTIYDGVVRLDARGEATISLPDYVEALNGDFRYQLTCLGGFAPVYVAQEISNHQFRIAGGKSGMKVSWQVTGLRQDAWTKANPRLVEEEKSPTERGYYLHPEAFGQPRSRGLAALEASKTPSKMRSKGAEPLVLTRH